MRASGGWLGAYVMSLGRIRLSQGWVKPRLDGALVQRELRDESPRPLLEPGRPDGSIATHEGPTRSGSPGRRSLDVLVRHQSRFRQGDHSAQTDREQSLSGVEFPI